MPEPFRCPECRHILPDGRKCHALALKDKLFCPAHLHRRTLAEANRSRQHSVALPPLENRTAIQMSIDEILAAMAAHKITRREAGTYLYAVQMASQNLARIEQFEQLPPPGPVQPSSDDRGDPLAAEAGCPNAGCPNAGCPRSLAFGDRGDHTPSPAFIPGDAGCPNAGCPRAGCPRSLAFGDLGDHTPSPVFIPGDAGCPNAGCPRSPALGDLEDHIPPTAR